MSDEISIQAQGSISNGSLSQSWNKGAVSINQTNRESDGGVESVGASEEDLTIANISTLGWLFLRNLDATNFVTYGPKSGGAMVLLGKLKAGEVAVLRLAPGITFRWIADTAPVKVEWLLWGD